MKYYLSLLMFLLIPIFKVSADAIPRVINIQTTIDVSQFITYQLTQFSMTPSQLNLVYIEENNSFREERVAVAVSTDAPSTDEAVQLKLRATELTSKCNDYANNSIATDADFVRIFLNDSGDNRQQIDMDNAVDIPINADNEGFKASNFGLWFVFGSVPDKAASCSGSASFTVEMTI